MNKLVAKTNVSGWCRNPTNSVRDFRAEIQICSVEGVAALTGVGADFFTVAFLTGAVFLTAFAGTATFFRAAFFASAFSNAAFSAARFSAHRLFVAAIIFFMPSALIFLLAGSAFTVAVDQRLLLFLAR